MRAANEFQNGNKVKQLRPAPTGHKFRGAASNAPRKNRTSETRRLARSIRDVAFANRRESRLRCRSGDRQIWMQPSARQAQVVRQTTWRIRSLEICCDKGRSHLLSVGLQRDGSTAPKRLASFRATAASIQFRACSRARWTAATDSSDPVRVKVSSSSIRRDS